MVREILCSPRSVGVCPTEAWLFDGCLFCILLVVSLTRSQGIRQGKSRKKQSSNRNLHGEIDKIDSDSKGGRCQKIMVDRSLASFSLPNKQQAAALQGVLLHRSFVASSIGSRLGVVKLVSKGDSLFENNQKQSPSSCDTASCCLRMMVVCL